MTCWKIHKRLPGYLDEALEPRERDVVREHLDFCDDCRRDLDRYRKLSLLMSRVDRVAPPPQLATQIRVAVSRARAQQPWPQRAWRRLGLLIENILEPLAVPATTGVVTALVVFAIVLHSLFLGVPLGAVPNDLPTALAQPARLESLAPFPVTVANGNGHSATDLLLVEATLNARGEVVNYQILSGPNGIAIRRQLDQVLMFSRFRPQMTFGRPQPGGRVVLSFSEIRVKG